MSRHSFEQDNGGSLAIGWDAAMATFFLQIDDQEDEPSLWEGTEFGQHPEPDSLVKLARAASAEVPASLADTLRAEKAASPSWHPVDAWNADRGAGDGLATGDNQSVPVPRTPASQRLLQRILRKKRPPRRAPRPGRPR